MVTNRPGSAAVAPPGSGRIGRAGGATRVVVSTFGLLAGLAGVEHGVGEILQGPVRPPAVVIESWPDSPAFEVLAGEPAMTVVPNLLLAGTLTVITAVGLALWSLLFVHRPGGAAVLLGLAVVLLLVGGGFAPPLLAVVLGVGAARIGAPPRRPPGRVARLLARTWPVLLAVGVLAYLALLPGTVLVERARGGLDPAVVYGLSALSFAAVTLALVAARAWDRVDRWFQRGATAPPRRPQR